MTSHDVHGIVVLSPTGPLHDGGECDRLEGSLRFLFQRGVRHIVVNLSEAGQLSARAMGVLARAHLEARRLGGRIAISDARPDHRRLFGITGLARVFDLRPSEADAVAWLEGQLVA